MTLVYPIGIPLLYAVLLYSSRKELALPELLAEGTPTHAWFVGESAWPQPKGKRESLEAKKAHQEWDEISASHRLSFLLEAYDRRGECAHHPATLRPRRPTAPPPHDRTAPTYPPISPNPTIHLHSLLV